MARKPQKPVKGDEVGTTGHSWDGIEELNNPMPRWWLWTFYATIIWGALYTIAYPAWPGITGASPGLLGYSTRAEVVEQIAEVDARLAPINEKLATVELTQIAADPELLSYAVSAGAAVFRAQCSQCHGSGAAGAKGYPNLLDNDWLWGGDIEAIHFTVTHGIRNANSDEARFSLMPAFGRDALLETPQIEAVVNYVMSLSGTPQDATTVAEGAVVYAENCASCHGEAAEGNRDLGAPALNDAIWLYGGDYATLMDTVINARAGVMPAQSAVYRPAQGLSEYEIRAVATYVHSLGGGE